MKFCNTHELSLIASAGLLCVCAGSAPAAVADGKAAPSMATAADTIRQEIDASMKELTALRETIATEKIPLTKQLSKLEEDIGEARREYDKTRRAVDARNLELTSLKTEGKQRQEEVSYITSLLDEFLAEFALNGREFRREEFVKLYPKSTRPYGTLYAY